MARIAELLGPPGVGKSTLVAALADRRLSDGRRIVPVTDLAHVPRRRLPRRIGRRIPVSVPPDRRRALLSARATEWGPFLQHVVATDGGVDETPLRRIRALTYTLATLELLALAHERPDGEVVVLDEGPLQRALTLLGPGVGTDLIARHVATAPPTDLVLHLSVDADTLDRRVDARARSGRVTDRHAGLDAPARRRAEAEEAALLVEVARRAADAGRTVVGVETADGPAAADRALRLIAARMPR